MPSIRTGAISTDGRTILYGDYVLIVVSGGAFITTPQEFQQVESWARARRSSGVKSKDRTVFVEKFQTVIARRGSGFATRGNPAVITTLVKAMKANETPLADWSIPPEILEAVR